MQDIVFTVIRCVIIIVAAVFLSALCPKMLNSFIGKLTVKTNATKIPTIRTLIVSIFRYFILITATFLVLSSLNISVGPILAVAGIGTVAIGFAAQSLVKDFLNGAFIIVDNLFNVGDIVTIGGLTGKVESIGLRTTKLISENGDVHIFPNSAITVVTLVSKKTDIDPPIK